eukprot:CAMPEP_0202896848 /NCGR_PEP_ID=MMETSP1392-20130828/5755_1 /ASSEMBLY_ACC=CAM_ASM_000868 /TAXON_ID=225041 /ORGANISM="Chlamydomonas chlamydogama, Strain SAG 11-48b" /LENGTH=191 /DNA_ID=CAMNT_0049582331 /DNA_START=639 /DNA_END=1214 /DNA_ORIENTATION=+
MTEVAFILQNVKPAGHTRVYEGPPHLVLSTLNVQPHLHERLRVDVLYEPARDVDGGDLEGRHVTVLIQPRAVREEGAGLISLSGHTERHDLTVSVPHRIGHNGAVMPVRHGLEPPIQQLGLHLKQVAVSAQVGLGDVGHVEVSPEAIVSSNLNVHYRCCRWRWARGVRPPDVACQFVQRIMCRKRRTEHEQ